jgi:hypothetical protein
MSEAASPTGLSRTSMVVPITNISSMSQAWIDALGLARHQAIPTPQKSSNIAVAPEDHTHPMGQKGRGSKGAFGQARGIVGKNTIGSRALLQNSARDRIAHLEKMRISKKIASIHPPQPDVFRRTAGRVTIISRKGTIRLLMQHNGSQLRMTVVCDPKLVSTISDALNATRLSYAARGITAHSEVHPEKV